MYVMMGVQCEASTVHVYSWLAQDATGVECHGGRVPC